MRFLSTTLCLLCAAPAAGQDLTSILKGIDDGVTPTAVALDTQLRLGDAAFADLAIREFEAKKHADTSKVRVAAFAAMDLLAAFPERSLARAKANDSGWADHPERSALRALHVIERLGESKGVLVAAKLGSHVALDAKKSSSVTAKLGSAATAILEREDGATRTYRSAYDAARQPDAKELIEVLRRRNMPSDLGTAYRLLERRPELDHVLLSRMQILARDGKEEAAGLDLGKIRAYLNHSDPRCRVGAANVAAFLDDVDAIPLLIELVDDRERAVGNACHQALERLTSLKFGAASSRWRHWYQFETAWWGKRGQSLVATLPSLSGVQRLRGLNELTAHPLYRRSIRPAVEPLLESRDEVLVRMTLSVLEATRSAKSLPAIKELCKDPRREVAQQARAVVASLTGRPIGAARRGARRQSTRRPTQGSRGE